MNVLIVVNVSKDAAKGLALEIQSLLKDDGIDSECIERGAWSVIPQDRHFDIAFSLGGDGTVLYAARLCAGAGIPVFPIHLGTLGFLATLNPNNWGQAFRRWREGHADVSARMMLQAKVIRKGSEVFSSICLNDAVISSTGGAHLIGFSLEMEDVSFPYKADGLIISTPTGSTAYSVAAGGPVMEGETESIIINPICPFNFTNKTLIVPAEEKIRISMGQKRTRQAAITMDGQIVFAIQAGDEIHIEKAPHKALLAASGRKAFYNALQTKLFNINTDKTEKTEKKS
jgi:NAD+ kinase